MVGHSDVRSNFEFARNVKIFDTKLSDRMTKCMRLLTTLVDLLIIKRGVCACVLCLLDLFSKRCLIKSNIAFCIMSVTW